MTYQISCYGKSEHIKNMSSVLMNILPCTTTQQNLKSDNIDISGEAQLVIFELPGEKIDTIPYRVIDYLEQLEGKKLLLVVFSTLPFSQYVKAQLERSILPFLNDRCEYLGLWLCPMESPESLVKQLENIVEQSPHHECAAEWLEHCRRCKGHPDIDDFMAVSRFVQETFEL